VKQNRISILIDAGVGESLGFSMRFYQPLQD